MDLMEDGLLSSMCLVSVICHYNLALYLIGSIYVIVGAVGILWFALWFLVGFSSPATHPRISITEKTYIEDSIAAEGEKEEV